MTLIPRLNRRRNRISLDSLAQQYYRQVRFYFSCRLDREAEVEEMTRATFRIAALMIDRRHLHGIDDFLLSVAENLLRHRWLDGCCCGALCGGEACSEQLEDQAAALYIKLRTLRGNSAASIENSAAIHHWIGRDARRQAAYDRARNALYGKGGLQPRMKAAYRITPEVVDPALLPDGGAPDKPASLGWTDVALLLLAFLLLLPMIYLLAVPVGSR